MSSPRSLFVYGTLAPGQPNHHILAGITGTWIRGTIRGCLYEEEWGAALGYPAMVLDSDGDAVAGFLLSSPELHQHLPMLDAFEGDGYRRAVTTVETEGGGGVEAYVYVLKGR